MGQWIPVRYRKSTSVRMCLIHFVGDMAVTYFIWWTRQRMIIMITIIMIMSNFYSANFNSDKSLCSKALMISGRHQKEAGKIHTIRQKCLVALWICDIKQMCLQTTLESVSGLGTLDGDRERVSERRGGMRKATLAKTFQAITRCRQEIFTLRS